MAGSNAGECKLFESAWESGRLTAADFDRRFGELGPEGDRIRQIYFDARTARGDSPKPLDMWSAALTDLMYRVPADRLLEANAAAGRPTYGYLFSWQSPAMGGALGACRGLDTFLMTGTHTLVPDLAGSGPLADALATTMMDAWVAIAGDGDPSTPTLPWPRFEVATRTLIELGESRQPVHEWHEEERRAWDGVIS